MRNRNLNVGVGEMRNMSVNVGIDEMEGEGGYDGGRVWWGWKRGTRIWVLETVKMREAWGYMSGT
jgi:hypothetical protein